MEDNIIASFSRNKSIGFAVDNEYEKVTINNCKVGDVAYIKPLLNVIFHTKMYKVTNVELPLIQIQSMNGKYRWINSDKFIKRLSFERREILNSGAELNFSLLKAQCGLLNESEEKLNE